jgi:heme A synthase
VSPSVDADRALGRFAAAGAALVFVVVASSAWLRLAAGESACPPGGCEAFGLTDAVRLAHRVAAMGVAFIAIVLAALAWRRPAKAGRRAATLAILALVAVLSVLGRSSAGNPTTGVVLGNLLGGLALLALVAALAFRAFATARGSDGFPDPAPIAVAALVVVAIAAGAAVSAGLVPPSPPWAAAHRIAGWLAFLASAFVAASPATHPDARSTARLAAGALGLAAITALAGPSTETARWLHNVLAALALLLAIGTAAAARRRAPGGGGAER